MLLTLDANEMEARPVLESVNGVWDVKLDEVSNGRYRYSLSAADELAPAVSIAVMFAGFALYELTREQRTLETVFAEVNAAVETPEVRDAA